MRLLVSVVSAAEARDALAGGADIIDVKDPAEGALGAPAPRVLSEVVAAVGGAAPVSVALGDLSGQPHTAALAAHGAALTGAGYVKVGLRMGELDRAVSVMRAVVAAVPPGTGTIAVAYADAEALDPPALGSGLLVGLAREAAISGVLVDTFTKDGRGLYGWQPESKLNRLVASAHAAGVTIGLAGQLRLGELNRVAADIVGVRSAVCREADRSGTLEVERVAAAVAEVRRLSPV